MRLSFHSCLSLWHPIQVSLASSGSFAAPRVALGTSKPESTGRGGKTCPDGARFRLVASQSTPFFRLRMLSETFPALS